MKNRNLVMGNLHLSQALRGAWKRLLLLCLVLFLFEFLFALLGASAHIKNEMAEDMKKTPAIVEKMMGEGFMEAMLKYGVMALGYIHPFMLVIFIIYIFITISQVITSEIATGRIGLLLTREISRGRVYINLAILVYGGLGIMALSAYAASALGVAWFHQGALTPAPFASLAWNLYLLMIFIAGYLAIPAALMDSGKRMAAAGGTLIALLYLLNLATPLWSPLKTLSFLNPFSYYNAFEVLLGVRPGVETSVGIWGASLVMFFIGAQLFRRRDIAAG